jgi:hypothetical protein
VLLSPLDPGFRMRFFDNQNLLKKVESKLRSFFELQSYKQWTLKTNHNSRTLKFFKNLTTFFPSKNLSHNSLPSTPSFNHNPKQSIFIKWYHKCLTFSLAYEGYYSVTFCKSIKWIFTRLKTLNVNIKSNSK